MIHLCREDLWRYIVASRDTAITLCWEPDDAPAIKVARQAYDQGKVEMVQYRNAGWVFLLAIPRKTPTTPRPYFSRAAERRVV